MPNSPFATHFSLRTQRTPQPPAPRPPCATRGSLRMQRNPPPPAPPWRQLAGKSTPPPPASRPSCATRGSLRMGPRSSPPPARFWPRLSGKSHLQVMSPQDRKSSWSGQTWKLKPVRSEAAWRHHLPNPPCATHGSLRTERNPQPPAPRHTQFR